MASLLLRHAIQNLEQLAWLKSQLERHLRVPALVLWLFSQATRRKQQFIDAHNAKEQLLASARVQAESGAISIELMNLIEREADSLPIAYARALEAVNLPLERDGFEFLSAQHIDRLFY